MPDSVRARLREDVAGLQPLDAMEQQHIAQVLAWIDSGAELCRLAKPATPPMHLVAYFVVVDEARRLLLVDHRQAQLWLPPGGHVEPGEHPRDTVAREIVEELGFALPVPLETPSFLTVTQTVGLTAGHTDVSLWYEVPVHSSQPIAFDAAEFASVRWFSPHELPLTQSDPHLARFLCKRQQTHRPSLAPA